MSDAPTTPKSFQEIILRLQSYWAAQGCAVLQPYDMEVGAGTFHPATTLRTGPAEFERLFPATGGSLYGPASHGWMALFRRPGAGSALPGLYLAGGSVHPGPGVPMAALSGQSAAATTMAHLDSISRSRRVPTAGGTSTRSATTVAMR